MTHRPLHVIAAEIYADASHIARWAAVPYIYAMRRMDKITDTYGADTGQSVVLYALSNLGHWRGPVARRIKAELKAMLKDGGYR